jgi:hypothetical protein
MKTTPISFALLLLVLFFCASCAGPRFQSVSAIPPGRGLVYIYSVKGGVGRPNQLTHNNGKLAKLGPNQYLVQFVEPGTNIYGFHMNFYSRGGMVGLLVTHHDPEPVALPVEAGKTYYLKVLGAGLGASFWRMEEAEALQELQEMKPCQPVKIEKAKRL